MCQQLNVFSFICVLFGAGFLFLVSIWYHVVFVVPSLGRLCIERKCKALQIRWPLRGDVTVPVVFGTSPPPRVVERHCVSAVMPPGASWELLPRSDIFYGELCGSTHLLIKMDVLG